VLDRGADAVLRPRRRSGVTAVRPRSRR
jgi:hypothetical protein